MTGGLPFAPKPRPCAHCESMFAPVRPMQKVCSPICAARLVRAEKAKEKAQFKERVEKAKRLPDLKAEAQKAFNKFIRTRDAGLPCICCGKPMEPNKPGGSVDAGHFRSRGAAPQLRYNENNVFAQRKNCNMPGGTTYGAFRVGVVARIGLAAVVALEKDNTIPKWTSDELRGIRDTYHTKTSELLKGRE